MSGARVRVEARDRCWEDRDKEFRILMGKFKKAVNEAGIKNAYMRCSTGKKRIGYETKGRKRRRKKREVEIAQLKAKINENFSQSKL